MKRKGEASRIVEELRIGEEMICDGLDQTCGDVRWTGADSISLSERGKGLAIPSVVLSCDGIDS